MKWTLAAIAAIAVVLAIVGIQLARKAAPNELAVAINTAMHSVPQFRERVEHPKTGDRAFFVRCRFGADKAAEMLWVRQVTTTPKGFRGTLDEEPALNEALHKGSIVDVKTEDVRDWAILKSDGTTEGAFTRGREPGNH